MILFTINEFDSRWFTACLLWHRLTVVEFISSCFYYKSTTGWTQRGRYSGVVPFDLFKLWSEGDVRRVVLSAGFKHTAAPLTGTQQKPPASHLQSCASVWETSRSCSCQLCVEKLFWSSAQLLETHPLWAGHMTHSDSIRWRCSVSWSLLVICTRPTGAPTLPFARRIATNKTEQQLLLHIKRFWIIERVPERRLIQKQCDKTVMIQMFPQVSHTHIWLHSWKHFTLTHTCSFWQLDTICSILSFCHTW